MARHKNWSNPLKKAVFLAGGGEVVARHFNLKTGTVWGWKECPPKRAADLAELSGGLVTKEQLCPDLYGEPARAEAA